MSTATYNISNSGSGAYTIDGSDNSILNLYRGRTYTLNINATGHPFWIQTTTIPYNSANVYNSGVINNGTENGTITFNVPLNAPDTLYYVCQYHSSMNGTINITNDPTLPTITNLPPISEINTRTTMVNYSSWIYLMTNGGALRQTDFSGNIINNAWHYGPSGGMRLAIINNYIFMVGGVGPRGITRITINSDGTKGEVNTSFSSTNSPGASSTPDIDTIFSYKDRIYFGSSNGIGSIKINPLDGSYISYKSIAGNIGYFGFILGIDDYVYIYTSADTFRYDLLTDVVQSSTLKWRYASTVSNPIIYGSTIYLSVSISPDPAYCLYTFDLSFNILSKYVTPPIALRHTLLANNSIYAVQNSGTVRLVISLPPLPPTYQYARMKINYNSIVNGNGVGGLVFDGYYSYQTNNNRVISLYSSTDMSTNLLISHTDSFATGALTLLGKTSANTAGITGIDTTSTHAGIFVKDLPFMNALFKSNPYVLLKPSGCVMFDNYGVVNTNILATSYFANKYVMSNGNVYSNKNNSFFSFSNFTFNYSSVTALPTVNDLLPIDYTFFNSISQIKYNAKYNGAVLLDSYFVFYLDSSNNYHMCAQYPKTENKNVLLFSDSACDNFPNTGNFGNTLGTVNPDPIVTTIVAVSGNAATATVTTSTVSATGTSSVSGSVTASGTVARVNLNALNSNICFSEGSIVTTDQGDVEIQNIDINYHTIYNNKIIALTETQSMEDYLVKIKKNALEENIPNKDTETTGNHMIFNGVSMVQAKTLINGCTIEKIPYRGLPLYNILLEQHNVMLVNGLVCETLNPENPIAKYYRLIAEFPENRIKMENMWRKRTQEIIHPMLII